MTLITAHAHIGTAPYETLLTARTHALRADEPTDQGGHDTGMSPFELLLGSLGACTNITLRMYADRKGWPLQAVDTRLTLERSPERNLITRSIALAGSLDEAQRSRLLQIANACPVHKLLTGNAIEVQTTLEPSPNAVPPHTPEG